MFKICSKCKKEKPIECFGKYSKSKDGYRASCKECDNNRYVHICKYCNKEFRSAHKEQDFCSRECRAKSSENRIICNCDICGKEISMKKSVYDKYKNHYCSIECKNEGWSKFYSGENNPNYKRVKINCEICGKEFIINQYKINSSKHHYCSYECQAKGYSKYFSKENHPMYGKHQSDECKRKISAKNINRYKGSKSPRWKSDLTDLERENNKSRHSDMEYVRWYKKVFIRDDYTCKHCGKRGKGNLNAHHLESYSNNEELRCNVNNGVTLCEKCHKEFHKIYGYGNNTKEQFDEYNN